jgi:hypothetical protein
MSCICIDADPPEAHWTKRVRARRTHLCCECRRTIGTGEVYECAKGVWEGEFHTYKTCDDCLSIRDTLFQCGWLYGEIWRAVEEYVEEVSLSDWERLTPVARGKLWATWESAVAAEEGK